MLLRQGVNRVKQFNGARMLKRKIYIYVYTKNTS